MTKAAEYQPQTPVPSAALPPTSAHLREVAAAMRAILEECGRPDQAPEVEGVHRLRTGTRRVEAAIETLAREAGARGLGRSGEDARQRWLRQLKKVRRASGAVRDLDVHREILAKNFLSAADEVRKSDTPPLVQQARRLEEWLAEHRTAAAQKLTGTLQGQGERLLEAEQRFLAAIAQRRSLPRVSRAAHRRALEDYLRLVDAMPLLDAENLHDFRKGAKKARYVAESDDRDAAAKAMAKAIRRVQDSIGEWHDWEMVAGEARAALAGEGAQLAAELDLRTHRAYERALQVAAVMGRRFAGEWQTLRPRRPSLRRPTPRPSNRGTT